MGSGNKAAQVDNLRDEYGGRKFKFKVGDRVKMVKECDGLLATCAATVVCYDGSSYYPYAIKFDAEQKYAHDADGRTPNGFGWWVNSDHIELVTAPKLKVGDWVRITNADCFCHGTKIGDTAIVTDDDCVDGIVCINLNHEKEGVINQIARVDQLERITDATPKFKVGDRVRNKNVPEAGVGIVETVNPEGGYSVNYKDTWYGVCHDDDSNVVAATTPTAIVVGAGGPSRHPRIHATRDSATKEAERLAKLHPGKEFAVYERVSAVVADVTVRAVA